MPFQPYHVVPITRTGELSQDVIFACSHFFAQRLQKRKINKDTYELVYTEYHKMHWAGETGDLRKKFEDEIAFLAENDPKTLEQRLSPVFAKIKDDSKGANSTQAILDLAASMGFEPEFYYADQTEPFNFYSIPFTGLKRPHFPESAQKLKIILSPKPEHRFDPKVIGVELPAEDVRSTEAMKQHQAAIKRYRDLMAGRIKATPMPGLSQAPQTQVPQANTPAPQTKTSASDAKPTASASPLDGISEGIKTVQQTLNAAVPAQQGGFMGAAMGFMNKAFDFVLKLIPSISSFISPLLEMIGNLFGGPEQTSGSRLDSARKAAASRSPSDSMDTEGFENPFEIGSPESPTAETAPRAATAPATETGLSPDLDRRVRMLDRSVRDSEVARSLDPMAMSSAPARPGLAVVAPRPAIAAPHPTVSPRPAMVLPGYTAAPTAAVGTPRPAAAAPQAQSFMPGFMSMLSQGLQSIMPVASGLGLIPGATPEVTPTAAAKPEERPASAAANSSAKR